MQQTLRKAGYYEPTPIQSQTLSLLLEKRDLLGIAQTGTGKTAAFAVPTIEHILPENRKTQVLVLCPTRELALQTADVFRTLSSHMKIRTVCVYGGQPPIIQIKAVRAGAQVIVGTPGRIKDLMQRRVIRLKNVRTVILDEADEMLDIGFLPDMKHILSAVTGEHQTMLFSATMNADISSIAQEFLTDPVRIEIGKKNEPVKTVAQSYLRADKEEKLAAVQHLLALHKPRLTLIFCNTRVGVGQLHSELVKQGVNAGCIHGELTQRKRDSIMARFRSGETSVMVATDVAARGIDVDDIDLVINYDIPEKPDYYVHRIGRTGRAGRTGAACTLMLPKELKKIRFLEQRFKITLNREYLPGQTPEPDEVQSRTKSSGKSRTRQNRSDRQANRNRSGEQPQRRQRKTDSAPGVGAGRQYTDKPKAKKEFDDQPKARQEYADKPMGQKLGDQRNKPNKSANANRRKDSSNKSNASAKGFDSLIDAIRNDSFDPSVVPGSAADKRNKPNKAANADRKRDRFDKSADVNRRQNKFGKAFAHAERSEDSVRRQRKPDSAPHDRAAEKQYSKGNASVSDRQYSKGGKSNAKADKPNVKADKPYAKSGKPNVKADKPNVKSGRPNAKADKPYAKDRASMQTIWQQRDGHSGQSGKVRHSGQSGQREQRASAHAQGRSATRKPQTSLAQMQAIWQQRDRSR